MNLRSVFNEVFRVEAPIAGAVFAIVVGLLLFAVVHYRAGRGHEPSKKSKHSVLEPVYAVVLIGIAIFLVAFTATANARERRGLGTPQLRVRVTAFQWCWRFHYIGTNVTVTGNCISGRPTLVLPTHERIRMYLISSDVVHEFWVPYLRYKVEEFPNHTNSFDLRLTNTGTWSGRCDEYCGLYHYRMDFFMKAVSPAQFRAFLHSSAAQRAAA